MSRFTTSLTDKIVEVALSQVGVKEDTLNNTGREVEMYQEATWLEPAAWPWCAAFTCWVLREARRLSHQDWVPLCFDASAYGWETWALKHDWLVLPEDNKAMPGDFVTYDFSHIGVVIEDNGDYIRTVEGNTNGKGERDSVSGDGVWLKDRPRHLVKSFIRAVNSQANT